MATDDGDVAMDDESEFEDDDEDPLPVIEEDDAMEAEEPADDRLEAAIADLVTVSQPAEIEDAAMEPADVERPRGTRFLDER